MATQQARAIEPIRNGQTVIFHLAPVQGVTLGIIAGIKPEHIASTFTKDQEKETVFIALDTPRNLSLEEIALELPDNTTYGIYVKNFHSHRDAMIEFQIDEKKSKTNPICYAGTSIIIPHPTQDSSLMRLVAANSVAAQIHGLPGFSNMGRVWINVILSPLPVHLEESQQPQQPQQPQQTVIYQQYPSSTTVIYVQPPPPPPPRPGFDPYNPFGPFGQPNPRGPAIISDPSPFHFPSTHGPPQISRAQQEAQAELERRRGPAMSCSSSSYRGESSQQNSRGPAMGVGGDDRMSSFGVTASSGPTMRSAEAASAPTPSQSGRYSASASASRGGGGASAGGGGGGGGSVIVSATTVTGAVSDKSWNRVNFVESDDTYSVVFRLVVVR